MNWYHRAERRYVEYGSSFEATRAFGLFRSLYDTVYNMNMAHLSDEAETVFERLADHGVRTACTPFLIYRGRTRHELGLEGLLRRVALAATFRHATWGPDELFYGELYSSRKVPCKPTLARPGTRDEYSACCGRELVENDLYDFLLFSLPDNDYHSHKFGPDAQLESIARADAALGRARRRGRWTRALPRRARGDRGRRPRPDRRSSIRCRSPTARAPSGGCCSRTRATPSRPSSRSARARGPRPSTCSAAGRRGGAASTTASASGCASSTAIDLFTWLEHDGEPVLPRRGGRPAPAGRVAVVERDGSVLRFRPGSAAARPPRRGLGPRRRPGGARGHGSRDRRSSSRDLPGRPGAALERAQRAARRRGPDLGEPRPRARRLGRGDALPGRQPRRSARRRLARAAAALRARARASAETAEPVGDPRRRRPGPRPLRRSRARARARRAGAAPSARWRASHGDRPSTPRSARRGASPGRCCAGSTSAPASRANWMQLLKFGLVGGSGYVVNLARVRAALRARSGSTTSPPRWAPSASR